MPWSVAPLRLGRSWVLAPDAASLTARWDRLLRTDDEADRTALFHPTRARTPHTAVAQLPGQPGATTRFARERGRCPQPVRIAHGPYDQQWLIPDHRLIDAARPELWRVADEHQIHLLEPAREAPPRAGQRGTRATPPGPPPTEAELSFAALLPDGHSPAGRPGRIRPLYRRPGAREPNVAPGLLAHLARRLGREVAADDLFAWIAAVARRGPGGATVVPLTASPELWEAGVALGRRRVWLHTRGARGGPAAGAPGAAAGAGGRPRLPGGQRPYVRAALTGRLAPDALGYDPEERALRLGNGRISPVAYAAWEYHSGGVRVLESWFERRATPGPAGTLDAIGPRDWPQEWTSDLLELITVLTLLAELREPTGQLRKELADGPLIAVGELTEAGVLPVPEAARRPASVLDHHEEGPEGQFALL
ncbi:DNA methyltransferase [Streptomyces sp. 71268]|uniref:type ISP restriction/modification enzyme n=1 Tax=Streptomyces sp. 71268 TaxID=3002640 RepID=UPI0023F8D9EA|nr:type ISP restriction/modification enzyme [Streptomyces sp. 71268]WEV29611.1 DNA methyltransferase [Streptomyces sp. 71268]